MIEFLFFKNKFPSSFFKNEKHNERREIPFRFFFPKMTESQTQRTPENVLEKKEFARRLMIGKEVEKDEVKAVRLLKECAEDGDAEAMLMLGECCALGRGVKHNSERAQVLLTYAAECGNCQAQHLMKLINEWKGEERIDLFGLLTISPSSHTKSNTFGTCSDERMCACTSEELIVAMNSGPFKTLFISSTINSCS